MKNILNIFTSLVIIICIFSNSFISVFAETSISETIVDVDNTDISDDSIPDNTISEDIIISTDIICILCGTTGHLNLDCPNKCKEHGIEHLDVNCSRHLICSLCGEYNHLSENCPKQCTEHFTEHLDTDCPRHSLLCELCNSFGHLLNDCPNQCIEHNTTHLDKDCPRHYLTCTLCSQHGHDKNDCPSKCKEHSYEHLDNDCPRHVIVNDKIYISDYSIYDSNGTPLTKIDVGDKFVLNVSIVDERIKSDSFGNIENKYLNNRIHSSVSQGSFSLKSTNGITVKNKKDLGIKNSTGYYNAICYTIEFKDLIYIGGTPQFDFSVAYTDYEDDPNISNDVPLPFPQSKLSINISQAVNDIITPSIILHKASYGDAITIGEKFTLSTISLNTSSNIPLENVILKLNLPEGITSIKNDYLYIENVSPNGEIECNFDLVVDKADTATSSLPINIIYSFEALVNGKRTQYINNQDFDLKISYPIRFIIQDISYDSEIYLGTESYLSAVLANKGKTTIYNVTAELTSDTLQSLNSCFIGDIESGKSANADFDFSAKQLGESTGTIVISYEDSQGILYTMEKDFSINVLEELDYDLGINVPATEVSAEESTSPIIVIIAIVSIVLIVLYLKRKKSKMITDIEDEYEDI